MQTLLETHNGDKINGPFVITQTCANTSSVGSNSPVAQLRAMKAARSAAGKLQPDECDRTTSNPRQTKSRD